jgi:hypothetical protein
MIWNPQLSLGLWPKSPRSLLPLYTVRECINPTFLRLLTGLTAAFSECGMWVKWCGICGVCGMCSSFVDPELRVQVHRSLHKARGRYAILYSHTQYLQHHLELVLLTCGLWGPLSSAGGSTFPQQHDWSRLLLIYNPFDRSWEHFTDFIYLWMFGRALVNLPGSQGEKRAVYCFWFFCVWFGKIQNR